ncbi:MAG: ABC transporter substrate-binding protein [candidate division NC10 bacterium]|nr:ABC transporter substrate-binding protein [candidate division NC10 bacterium]
MPTYRSRLLIALVVFMAVSLAWAQSPTAQVTPREELRVALGYLGTEALDPIRGPNNNGTYLRMMFDPLVGIDYKGAKLSKETGLAKDWKTSADGLTYTFLLHQGVKFQDGTEVTAEDVKFSLERLADPQNLTTVGKIISNGIAKVAVLDKYQVQVALKQPMPTPLYRLSPLLDTSGLVTSKSHFEKVGAAGFAEKPRGSGPYKFVRRQAGSFITFEQAAPTHWAIGAPRFKRVTFRLVSDENSRIAMLKAGDVDFIDVGVEKSVQLRQSGFKIFKSDIADSLVILMNMPKEGSPTRDINLRTALSYAIDRESLNKFLFMGQAPPTGNPFAGQIGGQVIPPDPYDLAKAKEFLAKTKYGPGSQKLVLELHAQVRSAVPQMQQVAQTIQSDWRKLGVDSEIVFGDYGTWRAKVVAKTHAPNAVEVLNYGGRVDNSGNAILWWGCNGLLSHACDPEFDALAASWSAATSDALYETRAVRVEKYVRDHYFTIPGLDVPVLFAGNAQIRGDFSPGSIAVVFNERGLVWNPKP